MTTREHEAESHREWHLPADARPPLIGELVERIDEALATARAAEAAAVTIGAAALDAAEEARRIAQSVPAPVTVDATEPPQIDAFSARADRVAERLQRLQRLPLSA